MASVRQGDTPTECYYGGNSPSAACTARPGRDGIFHQLYKGTRLTLENWSPHATSSSMFDSQFAALVIVTLGIFLRPVQATAINNRADVTREVYVCQTLALS